MKTLLISALLAIGLTTVAQAMEELRVNELAGYEQVEGFTSFRGLHSWTALDDETLILWATAHEPYLVALKYPSHDLKWAHAIAVTQFGSRVHAKFDSVLIRGFRYPIGEIYKLSRDEAKQLSRSWAE